MSESIFRSAFCREMPFKCWPVENPVGPGMSDVHYLFCHQRSGWIELKFLKSPKDKIIFQRQQPGWIRNYDKECGTVFIIAKVRMPKRAMYCVWRGCRVDEIRDQRLDQLSMEPCYVVYGPNPWGELAKIVEILTDE